MTDIIKEMNWRYATKEFDPTRKVSEEEVKTLLECLRLSPSSFGLQPWEFVVVENQEMKEKLVPLSYNQVQVAQCSHLIILCTPVDFTETNFDSFLNDTAEKREVSRESLSQFEGYMKTFFSDMNQDERLGWMDRQLFIALGVLLTAAARLKIDACPMEGFSGPDYDKLLGLDEKGLRSAAICPIGFRADGDKYIDLAKVRYTQDQIVSWIC